MNGRTDNPPDKLLICTDLDRTLIPNGFQEESPGARPGFRALVSRPEVTLAYVSGRDAVLVREAITDYALPTPDYVIGDVGTTIYAVGDPASWRPLASWTERIAMDWGGKSRQDLERLLSDVPELSLQEAPKQNRFKLSYYTSLQPADNRLTAEIESRLAENGVQANVIYSTDETTGVGLIDVLPATASKLHAIEFLMATQNFGLDNTVFSGDSGNDLEVLVSPIASILVANSVDDVKSVAAARANAAGLRQTLYVAGGGLLGMNGNYAAGILEGAVHYHPSIRTWLESNHND